MKVLLNVSREMPVGEWQECEAVKLVELADGSFDLVFTTDLATMREADDRVTDIVERIQKASGS